MSDRAFDRNKRLPPVIERGDEDLLPPDSSGVVVELSDFSGGSAQPKIDAEGNVSIETEDGGVIIQLDDGRGVKPPPTDEKFYSNLADRVGSDARGRIVQEVMDGIRADDQSRQQWLSMRAEGIDMLGTVLERATAGETPGAFEGLSSVRHPLLIEAVIRFQANASAELYPPTGPVKVRDDRPVKPAGVTTPALGDNSAGSGLEGLLFNLMDNPEAVSEIGAAASATRDEIADALEKGFNHNLTVVDRGYRADSVRMLFWVGFGGCAFKKVYECPIKRRPISRFVDAEDIIVNNNVSDHRDAERITHRIKMRSSLVRRMQIAGAYRTAELGMAMSEPNPVDEAKAAAQGLAAAPQRQEDQPRTLYESYTELDIPGLEHEEDGEMTGIPLPYKVTIDKDSQELLELRRNWDEGDETFTPRQVFVKFGFIPAMGFYDLGLLHLLGNGDKALTAAWREALDAGMLANFPGFIYNEGVIRNWSNQNRIPPGGGLGVKIPSNVPLGNVISPIPYKDVGPGMMAMVEKVEQRMDRVAGTAELPVGEGRQDAPVGTTIAMIEQATKVMAAVHVGLHASQAEEFDLLKERYRDNPTSFWKWNRSKKIPVWEVAEFLRALDDCEIVPAADPNTPSHMQRIMRAQAVRMMATNNPLYDQKKVDSWVLRMIGVSDPDDFFAPPPDPNQQPPMDPMLQATLATLSQKMQQAKQEGQIKVAELQQKAADAHEEHQEKMFETQAEAAIKEREGQRRSQEIALQSADRAATRESEEKREMLRLAMDHAKDIRAGQQQGLAGWDTGSGTGGAGPG